MASWGNPANIEVVNLGTFSFDRCKVASISSATVTMQTPCWTNQQATLANYSIRTIPSWVENAYELMAPGYWYLDTTAGYVYYWPQSGTMVGLTVVAPALDHLLTLTGASNLTFRDLNIEHSNWVGMDSAGVGYAGEQSGYTWLTYSTSNNTLDAAINVSGSTNITFLENTFAHLGSRAILVSGASAGVAISSNNTFVDNAAGLIQIGTVSKSDSCLSTRESNISITDNSILAGNEFDYLDNGAIFAPCVDGLAITGNSIIGTPGMPIAIGCGWDTPALAINATVTNNYINGACTVFTDCGGLYTNGSQSTGGSYATGLHATNNYLTTMTSAIGACLFPDTESAWGTYVGNVCQSAAYWTQMWTPTINNLTYSGNYSDTAAFLNNGTSITLAAPTIITSGVQPYGTPAQSVIMGSGTGCTSPAATSLWPGWRCLKANGLQGFWPY